MTMQPALGRAALTLGAISFLVSVPVGADCSDLERLVSLAPSNFEEVKGDLDPQTRKYPVKEFLPEAHICYVQVAPLSETYSYEWEFDTDEEAAVEAYQRLLTDVRGCLKPNEEKPRSSNRQGTTSESISFYLDDSIIVGARRMFHNRVQRNVVYMTFRRSAS